MTKIKILADRVIFDGHAETREECETITLLCDGLAGSPNFRTVQYEMGYAEFKKIGKAEKLKFPPVAGVSMNITANGSTVNISGTLLPSETTTTWFNVNQTTPQYSIENDRVIWLPNGEILQYNGVDVLPGDEIIGDGVYTTHAVAISGETWLLNSTITPQTASYEVNFTSNSEDYTSIVMSAKGTMSYNSATTGNDVYEGFWVNEAYRTITFETAPTGNLLTWLQANGTKQSAPTISFRHLYSGGTIGSGAVKFKAYTQTYLPQLATPANVAVSGTTVSWDAVENAESYDIYVDSTLYEKYHWVISSGETWLLNEEPHFSPLTDTTEFEVSFSINSVSYSVLRLESELVPMHTDAVAISVSSASIIQTSIYYSGSWVDEAYRTITFDEPVTDTDLLAWLQANGTKQ